MSKKAIVGGVVAAAVCATLGLATAVAHHAFAAEFDGNRPVNLQGPVTKVEWVNPHSWIHIDNRKLDGTREAWMVEGGTPNMLLRHGITKDSLVIGTEIVVRGYQSRDALCVPKCRANGRDITFPDGRRLFMGSAGVGAPKDGADPAGYGSDKK